MHWAQNSAQFTISITYLLLCVISEDCLTYPVNKNELTTVPWKSRQSKHRYPSWCLWLCHKTNKGWNAIWSYVSVDSYTAYSQSFYWDALDTWQFLGCFTQWWMTENNLENCVGLVIHMLPNALYLKKKKNPKNRTGNFFPPRQILCFAKLS